MLQIAHAGAAVFLLDGDARAGRASPSLRHRSIGKCVVAVDRGGARRDLVGGERLDRGRAACRRSRRGRSSGRAGGWAATASLHPSISNDRAGRMAGPARGAKVGHVGRNGEAGSAATAPRHGGTGFAVPPYLIEDALRRLSPQERRDVQASHLVADSRTYRSVRRLGAHLLHRRLGANRRGLGGRASRDGGGGRRLSRC